MEVTEELARFLVPPGDVPALKAKLGEVLAWLERESDLSEACTDHVARNFSKRAMVDVVEVRLADALR